METNNKLREALKLCMDEMRNRCRDLSAERGNPLPCLNGCEPVRKAKDALAAPARNCDRPECATTKAAQDMWRKEDGGLRKVLSGIAENLRIHLQLPAQTISMNRREVECMVNDCEKALGKEGEPEEQGEGGSDAD